MSYIPPYSIPKSSATTSTTNTNTTSESVSKAAQDNKTTKPDQATDNGIQAQLLRGMLETSESPKLQSGSPGVSDAAPAVVTVEDKEQFKTATDSGPKDLVSLFDKFDVSKEQTEEEYIKGNDKGNKDHGRYDNVNSKEHTQLGPALNTSTSEGNDKASIGQDPVDLNRQGILSVGSDDDDSTHEKVEEKDDSEDKNEKPETASNASPSMVQKALAMTIQPYDPFASAVSPDSEQAQQKDLSDITGAIEQTSIKEFELPNETIENELRSGVTAVSNNANDEAPVPDEEHHKSSASVDANEQYKQSHKPFDFDQFLVHLRKKSADPIVRFIRSFLLNFNRQAHALSYEQKIKIISDFKQFMNEKFALYEPFASMDTIDLENSREGLEKLIMNRLYDLTFPPNVAKSLGNREAESTYKDLEDDREFASQLEKFSWVNGSHLDIDLESLSRLRTLVSDDDSNFLDYAIQELNKINDYRAPRDKIICILNSCKIIFSFLKVNKQETSADSFIPLLILVIIKAKTDHFISNIRYIENYRGDEWLSHGETSYYLSSVQGAVGFISKLDFEQLKIDKKEYDAHLEAWQAEQSRLNKKKLATPNLNSGLETRLQQPRPQHAAQNAQPSSSQSFSPSSVLLTSAEMVSKSISNFLSPSPTEEPQVAQSSHRELNPPAERPIDPETMKSIYNNLTEIFPNIDSMVLKDLIVIKKGNQDECVEACLQLVNEV